MNLIEYATNNVPDEKWKKVDIWEMENILFKCGIHQVSLDEEKFSNFNFQFTYVKAHLSTDTIVGKKLYRLNNVIFMISEQESRKSTERFYKVNDTIYNQFIAEALHMNEDGLDDAPESLLNTVHYYKLAYSCEALLDNGYYISDFNNNALYPVKITGKGFNVDGGFCNGFTIKFGDGTYLTTTVDKVCFKEFDYVSQY